MLTCPSMRDRIILLLFAFLLSFGATTHAQTGPKNFAVIAYYAGRTSMIDSFEVEKLTHLIFCFCHLKGNMLSVGNARDSATIQRMVALKSRNPNLKIILSLGGGAVVKPVHRLLLPGKAEGNLPGLPGI